MKRKIINPWKWQDSLGFVQANDVSDAKRVVYCSGQTSVDAQGNPINAGDMEAQINQVLDNLETVLGQTEMSLENVIRINYYTTDTAAFMAAISMVADRFAKAGCQPASTLLGVSALFHPDIMIEMEATAVA